MYFQLHAKIEMIRVDSLVFDARLLTMISLDPCGIPYSTGTPNNTVKKLTLFSAIINRIMMESPSRISNPGWQSRSMTSNLEPRLNVTVKAVEAYHPCRQYSRKNRIFIGFCFLCMMK